MGADGGCAQERQAIATDVGHAGALGAEQPLVTVRGEEVDWRFTHIKRKGAQALNGVDELWSDVRQIAEAWEHVVGSYVAVNLYAVWAGQHGFKIHTDGHDTLLLQVDGTKHWRVYAPDAEIDKALETQKAEPALSCAGRESEQGP